MSREQQVERQYESHGLAVCRYFCMMGVAPEVAEELCQECFLRLFHAVKRKERIRSVRAWLFRVAHNLALNSLAIERGRQRYRAEWLDASGRTV